MSDGQLPVLQRIPTGIPGLDRILDGGLIRGGGYLLVGQPGAGKTILSNQMCFHHVATGGRALYVTVLAESHSRLLGQLRSLNFFDATPLSDTLQYLSAYSIVEQSGLRGLLDMLRHEVRNQNATLVVLDGLSTIEAIAESDVSLKRFISNLQASLDMLGCTTIFQTQPAAGEHWSTLYTMVDGVIMLHDETIGLYPVREIEVQKLRGSAHLRGRHQFQITNDGITIFPRTESLYAHTVPHHATPPSRRLLGITRLDEMLGGGLVSGSNTLLLGPPGAGKTLLGLHLLTNGAQHDQRGLYFGFYETPDRLLAKADAIGLDMSGAVARQQIDVLWQPPIDNMLDALAERLLAVVAQNNVQRVFIDGMRGFVAANMYPGRMSHFFAALTNELRARDVTAIWSSELPDLFGPHVTVPVEGTAELVDNIIFVRYVELRSQLYRLISLLKLRESAYDPVIREFHITSQGINVAATFESAEAILTGVGRLAQNDTHQRTRRSKA